MPTSSETLALEGGAPVRATKLSYGRQWIDETDILAVTEVLGSDWLTTGPTVQAFEQAFADFVGMPYAVAVSNGTAALHAAMYAIEIGPGDEVIVPPLTFAASANCVVFQGATPVFADVDPETLLLAPQQVERHITSRTKAIIAVDYTGHACDYDALHALADRYGLIVVADACHALGGAYRGRPVGSLAHLNTFSFHPVKHLTTGEGGMITTENPEFARRMRLFRNHGITSDHHQREARGAWFYEMVDLGYNYRITDVQCALGLSQLRKLPQWVTRRQQIARQYHTAFRELPALRPLSVRPEVTHAYHLYVVRLVQEVLSAPRNVIFKALLAEGIGVNVHYIPVHLHPFYKTHFSTTVGMCPVAEAAYDCLLTLPLFPAMTDRDSGDVIRAANKVLSAYYVS
jgi:perosamine synthetase